MKMKKLGNLFAVAGMLFVSVALSTVGIVLVGSLNWLAYLSIQAKAGWWAFVPMAVVLDIAIIGGILIGISRILINRTDKKMMKETP